MKHFTVCGDKVTFQELAAIGSNSATSDLEHEVRGLLLYAADNASDEDIDTFMQWLDGGPLTQIHTHDSDPGDHFECAEGKSWKEMEQYYSE